MEPIKVSQMNKFTACITQAIKQQCSRLVSADGVISYENAKLVVAQVQRIYLTAINTVPENIQIACNLALATVAPTLRERMELLKRAVALASGIAGIAAIISGVGLALGWGVGVGEAIVIWFTGGSMLGPVAWITCGVGLSVVAGYFLVKNPMDRVDVFENALVNGVTAATKSSWDDYGERLLTAVAA